VPRLATIMPPKRNAQVQKGHSREPASAKGLLIQQLCVEYRFVAVTTVITDGKDPGQR